MARFSCSPILVLWMAGTSFGAVSTWNGATGNWSSGTNWSTTPVFPNNSGTNTYDAQIGAGAVTVNQTITINRLVFTGGAIDGSSTLNALQGLAWTGGTLRGSGTLALSGTTT